MLSTRHDANRGHLSRHTFGTTWNGNVDLTDDRLSISNASEVVWWPQPSVSFAAPNPDVCVGGCITLEVTLTGTPPFGLTVGDSYGGECGRYF
ncbi:MAG: hypothetical protein R2788_17995 [Saprospiraceae bacterium]